MMINNKLLWGGIILIVISWAGGWHGYNKYKDAYYRELAMNAKNVQAIRAVQAEADAYHARTAQLSGQLAEANRATIRARIAVDDIRMATGEDIAALRAGTQEWSVKFDLLNEEFIRCGSKVAALDAAWQACANEVSIAAKVIDSQNGEIVALRAGLQAAKVSLLKTTEALIKATSKANRRLFPAVFGGYGVQGWTVGVGVAIKILK